MELSSRIYYVKAFAWRNYDYSKKLFEANNAETVFMSFKALMENFSKMHNKTTVCPGMDVTG